MSGAIQHKLTPLERAERRLGFAMLAPAFLLLAAVVLYPIASLIWTSFHFNHLAQPWMGNPFVGFENYAKALGDDRFWEAVLHTAIYIVITVPGAVVVGLGLACLPTSLSRSSGPCASGCCSLGSAACLCRTHLPLVLRIQSGHRQRDLARPRL